MNAGLRSIVAFDGLKPVQVSTIMLSSRRLRITKWVDSRC